jgi:hypothetical protein
MKHKLLLAIYFLCIAFTCDAQAPNAIPYQAVARDNNGNVIANQNISLRFTILQGSTTGTVVYQETQSTTTNDLGLFSVNVMTGETTGPFDPIKWNLIVTLGAYIKVEMDAAGGTSYVNMGTQQMLSVPFALYAEQSGYSIGSVIYSGTWNAVSNIPSLANNTGTKGTYYVVSNAATRDLGSGPIDFQVSDWAIFNGTKWEKVDNTDAPVTAANVSFTPNGDIASGNVQGAITEVRDDADTKLTTKLNLSGGTLTGNLILNANPLAALGAAPKQYVDAADATLQTQVNSKLNLSGGTMTGNLILNANPSLALGAVTKQYADAADATKLNLSGGTLTGNLILNANPTNVLGAATKQYVDALVSGSPGWSITGNSNTTDGTNFIGTTNTVALNFKVNNRKAGRIDFTNPNNTFFGYTAGDSITTGRDNTAFGHSAFSNNKTGNENTAFGESALLSNVAAWGNTAVGYHSQYYASNVTFQTFPYNTSLGHNSLQGSSNPAVNTGTINTAIGAYTLYNNTAGGNNTALGFQALIFNTTGSLNLASGYNALYSNITGDDNTAIGNLALYSSVAGNYGVAIGEESQYYAYNGPTWSNSNTSVGYLSLRGSATPANNLGLFNTAVGNSALMINSTGSYNTCIGNDALINNTIGNFNTATGYQALLGNDAGLYNTASGYQAIYSNSSGIRNTGYGYDALFKNSTGSDNTGCGQSALYQTTASSYNTALGAAAGDVQNNGSFNTFIGHAAYSPVNAGLTNSTCIGDNTSMTASNQVRIGNGVTSIGGPQNWSNTSDRRIKLNIHEDVPGLSFIKLLKPVTYNKSLALENEITGRADSKKLSDDNDYERIRYTGFIAQDVEEAAKNIGYDFSGVDSPKNSHDLYSLRYAEFVVPLVKAVQEQQAMIADQKIIIAEMKKENETLKADNVSFKNDLSKIKTQLGMDVKAEK